LKYLSKAKKKKKKGKEKKGLTYSPCCALVQHDEGKRACDVGPIHITGVCFARMLFVTSRNM